MRNRKNNKRALIVSALSLLLCVSMLVGSTMAWFTDNATTAVNTIQAGTLDIDLVDKGGNSLEGKSLNFVDEEGNVKTNILWEPGARYLLQDVTLINKGNLAVKYKVMMNYTNDNAEDGVDLGDVIDVYVGDVKYGTLSALSKKDNVNESTLLPNGKAAYEGLKLVMQEGAGNEYQGKSLSSIAVTVMAKQHTYETDSYDDQYDAGAEYNVTVSNNEELLDAIKEGKPVVLKNDITLDVAQYDVYLGTAETKEITIDGGGHTITFQNGLEQARIYTVNPDAVLNISNATIARANPTVGNYLTFLSFYCNTNLTNVKAAESINLWGVGKTYNLNNVEIVDNRTAAEHYAMFIKSGNTVTMDNCVFDNDETGNRAVKISDVNSTEAEAQALTTLTVKNTTFASNKKAAILIGTKYGANVTLENVDISNVAADSTNAVWVEDTYASYTDTIVVTGGTKVIER